MWQACENLPKIYILATNIGNCEEQLPLTDCRSTVGRLSADKWPTVGRLSADKRPTVGRQTTDNLLTGFRYAVGQQAIYLLQIEVCIKENLGEESICFVVSTVVQ